MAKQIYIDENGNPIEVSGTINTAELLPISGNDPTDTKSYIDTGLSGKVGAWTYNGQYTINGVTGSVTWDLLNAIPNGTKELMFGFCVGASFKRVLRYTIIVPYDVFETYGCMPTFAIASTRVSCTLVKASTSQITISDVIDGGGSDMTLNCFYR